MGMVLVWDEEECCQGAFGGQVLVLLSWRPERERESESEIEW